jgi:hypothetical protein
MTIEVISSSSDLADGASLDVIGPTDLSTGAVLLLRFTFGPQRSGRALKIEDSGARAVIEVDSQRWWLHRRSVVNVGQVAFHPWAVGGRCEG